MDSVIGNTFKTPKGATITIIGINGLEGVNKKYICNCSICSKDEELFPYGSMQVSKSNISKQNIPCACSSKPKWKEWQNKIRVQRECDKRGYIFHGWSDDYKGAHTYLDLENPETGNRWFTCTISHFIGGSIDPYERQERAKTVIKKPDNHHINLFKTTGKFLGGTIFWKNTEKVEALGRFTYWNYTCPVCSNDEYVKAGLCSGVFTSHASSLKNGTKSCRCSDNYRLTQDQREYQIKKICKEEGLTFLGWEVEGDCKNYKSKVKWVCSKGNINTTMFYTFTRGTRCNCCTKYGYNPEKSGNFYITRWFGYCESFIKFGITNKDVIVRLTEQNKTSKHLDYEILYTFNFEDGYIPLKIENDLKNIYGRSGVCPKEWLPDGYTETVADTEINIETILHLVEKYNIGG